MESGGDLDDAAMDAMERLLALDDHDLWYLVSGQGDTGDTELRQAVDRINEVHGRAMT
jgi:succinate dehydrogenase flavin-adding protein (antitoxin of CptAB toxin-antitoxin module)